MGEAYSFELRETAEDLYVTGGRTFDQVAQMTGVSSSQLKRWAAEAGWTEKRQEYRHALSNIEYQKVMLRKRMYEKALESLDPQDVYAIASLEAAAARAKRADDAAPAPVLSGEPKVINTPQEAVTALQEAVEKQINAILSQPGTSLSSIKDIKKSLELIQEMRERYAPQVEADDSRQGGLTPEAAEEIRRKILGIK